jgi:hypothetical protein
MVSRIKEIWMNFWFNQVVKDGHLVPKLNRDVIINIILGIIVIVVIYVFICLFIFIDQCK